jgi:uncharacterized membrane protein required for colicin V production
MWLDVLALLLLAIFAWLGARRGALATGLSLAGIVCGYAAAIFAATHLGGIAADLCGVSPFFGAPIAGTLAFAFVALDFAVVSFVLRRRSEGAPTVASRIGGACFGALRGSLLVLMIGVLALWIDAMPQLADRSASDEPAVETPLRSVARAAVTAGVETALGDTPGADLAAHALAQPGEAIEQLRALAATPEIAALAEDGEFWAYVEGGAVEAALAQPSFQRIQWNTKLRRKLAAVGVVDEVSAGDPAIFALEMRGALAKIGPRLRQVREDPDLARLANDPAVVDLVQRRDVVGLLANPGFQRVLTRALAPTPNTG